MLHNTIVYIGIGFGAKILVEQFNIAALHHMARGVGRIVRARAGLLDSRMEDCCDRHEYTFCGREVRYRMIDFVKDGVFYCLGSEIDADLRFIEKLFDQLLSLVQANPSDFINGNGDFSNYRAALMNYCNGVYDSSSPPASHLTFGEAKPQPAVLYAFVAYKSVVLAEYVNWSDGLAALTQLKNEVKFFKPWSQQPADHHHQERCGMDWNTIIDGDFVYFMCSSSISKDDCHSALKELSCEFPTYVKRIGKARAHWSKRFVWELRKILCKAEGPSKKISPGHKREWDESAAAEMTQTNKKIKIKFGGKVLANVVQKVEEAPRMPPASNFQLKVTVGGKGVQEIVQEMEDAMRKSLKFKIKCGRKGSNHLLPAAIPGATVPCF